MGQTMAAPREQHGHGQSNQPASASHQAPAVHLAVEQVLRAPIHAAAGIRLSGKVLSNSQR